LFKTNEQQQRKRRRSSQQQQIEQNNQTTAARNDKRDATTHIRSFLVHTYHNDEMGGVGRKDRFSKRTSKNNANDEQQQIEQNNNGNADAMTL
jgi:hypothetical protein